MKMKKVLSILLVVCMLASMTPVYAAEDTGSDPAADVRPITDGNARKSDDAVGGTVLKSTAPRLASKAGSTVTITGITVEEKEYDGSKTVNLTATGLEGLPDGYDYPNSLSFKGSLASADAGTHKLESIDVTTISITDGEGNLVAGQFNFVFDTNTTGTIRPRKVVIDSLTAYDKTYDGTTAGQASVSGLSGYSVDGFKFDFSSATVINVVFDSPEVGENRTITVPAENYSAYYNNQPVKSTNFILTGTGRIIGKELTASGTGTASGTYGDALSAFSVTATPTVSYEGTEIPGTWKPVDGSAKPEPGKSYYDFVFVPTGTGYALPTVQFTVDTDFGTEKYPLTYTGFTVKDKEFDNSNEVELVLTNAEVTGLPNGFGAWRPAAASGTLESADAGTHKLTAVDAVIIIRDLSTGEEVTDKFDIRMDTTGITGTIKPIEIHHDGFIARPKTYDGSTAMSFDFDGGNIEHNTFTISVNTRTGTYDTADAGDNKTFTADPECYTVTADGDITVASKNFIITGTGSIKPAGITLCTVAFDSTLFTYSGSAPDMNITVVDNRVGSKTLTEGVDYELGPMQKDAGDYTVTVTGKGNYIGQVKIPYWITAKEVSITGAEIQAVTYDPDGYTLTVNNVTFNGVVDGETLGYTAKAELSGNNAAGSQNATVTVTLNNSNYILDTATYAASVTINKAFPTVTDPENITATYGETLNRLPLPTADGDTPGEWRWEDAGLTAVGNVGINRFKAWFYPEDRANYYEIGRTLRINVEPKEVTVTGVTAADRDYNGETTVTLTGGSVEGIIGSDYVTVDLSEAVGTMADANVGENKAVTVTGVKLSGAAAGNYKLAAQPTGVTVTIMPLQLNENNLALTAEEGPFTYTGKPIEPRITFYHNNKAIPADQFVVSYENNVNVGNAKATFANASGANYLLPEVITAEGTYMPFEITPAKVTITAEDKSAPVGSKAPALTYTVTGLLGSDKLLTAPTVSYEKTPNMNYAGSTNILVSGADAGKNYTIAYVTGKLNVYVPATEVRVDMSGVNVGNKTYDGKALTYTGEARGNYPVQFTYTWYNQQGGRVNAPTDAGTYVLRATVNSYGYTGYGSKTVTIEKAQITVTAEDLTAEVGAELPELTYTVTGLAEGDTLKTEPTLTCEADMTKAGEYAITLTGAAVPNTKNYEPTVKYVTGALTVTDPATEEEPAEEPADTPAEPSVPVMGDNTGAPTDGDSAADSSAVADSDNASDTTGGHGHGKWRFPWWILLILAAVGGYLWYRKRKIA